MFFRSFWGALIALGVVFSASSLCAQNQQEVSITAIKNIEMRLIEVEDQLRLLTGKVEKSDYLFRRIEESLQKMQEDYEARLMKLEQAPPPSPPVSSLHKEADEDNLPTSITGTLGGVKIRNGKVTGAVSDPKAPPLPEKPDDYGLTPQEMYDRAFGLLRQANYEQAEVAFKNFIEKYPKDKLAENAKYWYAETYYVRGLFGDAAVSFAEAYQQNPEGTKAPDSLLKLAMSLAGVDKITDACSTLQALKIKFPKASFVINERRKSEWARLKCK